MKRSSDALAGAERMRLVQEEACEQAFAEARAKGALNERARIQAILASPEAKYKSRTAFSIATKSDLSVEDARNLLASLGQGSA